MAGSRGLRLATQDTVSTSPCRTFCRAASRVNQKLQGRETTWTRAQEAVATADRLGWAEEGGPWSTRARPSAWPWPVPDRLWADEPRPVFC